MIIFGSILTTFELRSVFGGSWGNIENWLKPKTEPSSGNLIREILCIICFVTKKNQGHTI